MTFTDRLNAGSVRRYLAVVAALALAIALLPLAGTATAQTAPGAIDVTTACEGAPQDVFDDVAEGNPHAENISCLFGYGITQGTDDGGYAPAEGVRRQQMALFLVRLAEFAAGQLDGVTIPEPTDQGFTDIAELTQEARDAVNVLAELGVTEGRTTTTFDPFAFVERDEMASFINRLQGVLAEEYASTEDFFDDDDNVHEENINALASVGIVEGFGNNTYGPNRDVTRGQMASFIMRHVQENVNTGVLDPIDFPDFSVTMSWINENTDDSATEGADADVEFRQGEPGATGSTQLWLDAENDTVSFVVDYSDVTGLYTGYHIHSGAIDENGPIELTLATPEQLNAEDDMVLEGEVTEPATDDAAESVSALIDAIVADPDGYYVNLHTEDFGGGAIRGQLPTGGQEEIPEPTEAADGNFNVTVGSVDEGSFVGVNVDDAVLDNEGLFNYDEADTYLLGGVASDLATFEAALSVGDRVSGTYSTTATSTFDLTDVDAEPGEPAGGPTAQDADTNVADGVTFGNGNGETLSIDYDAAPVVGDPASVSVDWDGGGVEAAVPYTCDPLVLGCTVEGTTLTLTVIDQSMVADGTYADGTSAVTGTEGVTGEGAVDDDGFPVTIDTD